MAKSIVAVVIALLLIGGALLAAVSTIGFMRASLTAPGRVVALRAGGSHPTIDFTTAGGEAVSYNQNGLVFGHKVGEAVRVRYLADRPRESARLDGVLTNWGLPIVLALFGAAFLWGAASARPGASASETELVR